MTWSARFVGHAVDTEAERAVAEKLKAAIAELDIHEARFFSGAHTGDLLTMDVTPPVEPPPAPEPPPVEPAAPEPPPVEPAAPEVPA